MVDVVVYPQVMRREVERYPSQLTGRDTGKTKCVTGVMTFEFSIGWDATQDIFDLIIKHKSIWDLQIVLQLHSIAKF